MRITALGETRDWPGGLTLQGWLDLAGVENQEMRACVPVGNA